MSSNPTFLYRWAKIASRTLSLCRTFSRRRNKGNLEGRRYKTRRRMPERDTNETKKSRGEDTMSATSKGRDFENFVEKQLIQAGYDIQQKAILSTKILKFGGKTIYVRKSIDIFGMWDICATRINIDGTLTWIFVQAKCNKSSTYGKQGEKYREWARKYCLVGMNCFFAIKTKVGRRTSMNLIRLP